MDAHRNLEIPMSHRTLSLLLSLLAATACSKSPEPQQGNAAAPTATVTAPADPGPFSTEAQAAAGTIDGKLIQGTVAEIASDAYAGRAPGSQGDIKARAWLAAEMQKIGFAPGAAASLGTAIRSHRHQFRDAGHLAYAGRLQDAGTEVQ